MTDKGGGRLAFVCGEAGVGKTLLLRRFCDGQASAARVLWGSCDPLFAPRPLGPLVDVAQVTGGELGEVVRFVLFSEGHLDAFRGTLEEGSKA